MSTDGTDRTAPRPVPELAPLAPEAAVTDDDRNRYGVLLDRAAERGLLSPVEYQARLTELADAASVDELQRIVTELPAFAGSGGVAVSPGRDSGPSGSGPRTAPDPAALDSALWATLTPSARRRSAGNPWVVLAVLVAVLLVALVVLALIVAHVGARHVGAVVTTAHAVSRLRP